MAQRPGIDPSNPNPLYLQLADILREQIHTGEHGPGDLLPAERRLAQIYELGIDTVRDAMAVLRREGLIVTRRGQGSMVPELPDLHVTALGPGWDLTTRAPTEDERRRMRLAEGTPIVILSRPGQPDRIVPGGPGNVFRTQAEEPEDAEEPEQD